MFIFLILINIFKVNFILQFCPPYTEILALPLDSCLSSLIKVDSEALFLSLPTSLSLFLPLHPSFSFFLPYWSDFLFLPFCPPFLLHRFALYGFPLWVFFFFFCCLIVNNICSWVLEDKWLGWFVGFNGGGLGVSSSIDGSRLGVVNRWLGWFVGFNGGGLWVLVDEFWFWFWD